jgi:hypothetical protein
MVEGGGFEPPKAEPSDLQSDPFGHSGTPPGDFVLFYFYGIHPSFFMWSWRQELNP